MTFGAILCPAWRQVKATELHVAEAKEVEVLVEDGEAVEEDEGPHDDNQGATDRLEHGHETTYPLELGSGRPKEEPC